MCVKTPLRLISWSVFFAPPGISVWWDSDLNPGDDWRTRIRQSITRDALAFVACFSANSTSRDVSYQRAELTLAIEQDRAAMRTRRSRVSEG